jgi:serine/threonine protein kinase
MPDPLNSERVGARREARDPQGAMAGSYRIARPIARGTLGLVFLGEHPRIGAKAAVKVLREELAADQSLVDRFVEEARAAAAVRHANMVKVYDLVYLPDGRPAVVMELLEGRGLDKALALEPLEVPEALELLSQVGAVLASTHARGVVHRNIKAEKVLLVNGQDGRERAKVLDFGLAKVADRSLPVIPGKPQYLAPEIIRGEEVDARADLYALGVLGYRLTAGRFPFEGRSAREVARKHVHEPVDPEPLPAAVRELVLKLLAKRPADRFPDDAALARALRELEARYGFKERACAALPPSRGGRPFVDAPTEPYLARFILPDSDSESAPPRATLASESAVPGDADPDPDPIPDPEVEVEVDLPLDGSADATVVRRIELEPVEPLPRSAPSAVSGAEGGEDRAPGSAEEAVSRDSVEEDLLPDFGPDDSSREPPTQPGVELAGARATRTSADDAPGGADRGATPQARLLARFLELSERDHYSFLSIPEDAEAEVIRDACGRIEKELLALRDLVWPAQRPQVVALLGRLERARRVLDDLEARAAYDARRGNHRGVACCMAAGFPPTRVDKLRQDYIRRSPELVDRARRLAHEAQEHADKGEVEHAARAYSQALALDPLSRELHRRLQELLSSGGGEG